MWSIKYIELLNARVLVCTFSDTHYVFDDVNIGRGIKIDKH